MASEATSLWGPTFIGLIFNVLLYGITVTQIFVYFTVYKTDRLWMKLFVVLLFLCDTLQSVLDVIYTFDRLVSNYGNFDALAMSTWALAPHPVMIAITASLVQMFFAWRIKVLTQSWILVFIITVCSFAQLCGGIGSTIGAVIVPELPEFQKFKVVVIIWLAFSAITDVTIAASLTWHLRKQKTGFAATDDIINRIVRLTVQTGSITAVFAIVDMICFLATPSSLHLAFNFILPKLYANSLLSSLNSRSAWGYGHTLHKPGDNKYTTTSSRIGGMVDSAAGSGIQAGLNTNVHQVVIDVESIEMRDEDHKALGKSYGPSLTPLAEENQYRR